MPFPHYRQRSDFVPSESFIVVNHNTALETVYFNLVAHNYTGQYEAVATNAAGEARNTADLLVVNPEPTQAALFEAELKVGILF